MRNATFAKRPIQGTTWYNLLANPRYIKDFAYVSCMEPNRASLIVDDDSDDDNNFEQSDMVKIILNYGFVDDELQDELVFGQGISKRVRGHFIAKKLAMTRFGGLKDLVKK